MSRHEQFDHSPNEPPHPFDWTWIAKALLLFAIRRLEPHDTFLGNFRTPHQYVTQVMGQQDVRHAGPDRNRVFRVLCIAVAREIDRDAESANG